MLMLSVRAGEVFSVPVATDWYLNTNLLSQTTLTEQECKQQTYAIPPPPHTEGREQHLSTRGQVNTLLKRSLHVPKNSAG